MSTFSRLKRSTGRFLRQVFHRPKAKISRENVLVLVTLVIVFFTALLLRIIPMIDTQPIVREFDSWFQLKIARYVVENGYGAFFTWHDDATWVPFGRDVARTAYFGVPFTSSLFYFIANGLGISVDLTIVCIVFPAIMGALCTIVMFFLGREFSNNTVGMLSALFMAFLPAYIQRTVAGFFDNESIGVFAIVLTLLLFVRSLKRNSIPSAVAAGFALAYLMVSWGASDFLMDLFALYAFVMLVIGRYSRRLLSSYLITLTIGFFFGNLAPRNGFREMTSFGVLVPIGVAGLLVLHEIWLRSAAYRDATAEVLVPHMRPILLGLLTPLIGVGVYMLYITNTGVSIAITTSTPFLVIGGKFLTVINPFFRLEQRIFASVAEHLPSPWASFYYTLGVLVIIYPLGMYFAFKRRRDEDVLLVLYGLTATYFAGSMIRLSLILAPAASLLSAMAITTILTPFAKIVIQKSSFERRRFRISKSMTSEHTLLAYVVIGTLLGSVILGGTAYATNQIGVHEFAYGTVSSGNQWMDWQTAMNFIRNVLPAGSTIAAWWDYGYWITNAGGAKSIVDNSTHNSTQIALMGYALMALNLTESLRIFHRWNASYVLVFWGHRHSGIGGDDGKWPWMVRIAEDRLGSKLIDDKTYLGDNPSTSNRVEDDYTLDAFFKSTLYRLMLYGEPKNENEANQMGLSSQRKAVDVYYYSTQYESDTRWVNNIPSSLYGAFTPVFTSYQYGLVKIYKIDYSMYYQYLNRTQANWRIAKGSLSNVRLDGSISTQEKQFNSYNMTFGPGYDATVYTRANATHIYYGIVMNNYDSSHDALGLQIAPFGVRSNADIRVVDYDGHAYYDGYIDYAGNWLYDISGANASEYAKGTKTIEFLFPLNSEDVQDVCMRPGMNYELRLLFWHNMRSGEPTFVSSWTTFWVPTDLY